MFERYWKPYFDTVTNNTGSFLEKVFQSPTTMTALASVLNTFFRLKVTTDKAKHLVYKGLGWPTYRDQKKLLYYVMKLEGQMEDLQEQLQVLEDWKIQKETLLVLQEQVDLLQVQLEAMEDLQKQKVEQG